MCVQCVLMVTLWYIIHCVATTAATPPIHSPTPRQLLNIIKANSSALYAEHRLHTPHIVLEYGVRLAQTLAHTNPTGGVLSIPNPAHARPYAPELPPSVHDYRVRLAWTASS